jgi:hypothetical protein
LFTSVAFSESNRYLSMKSKQDVKIPNNNITHYSFIAIFSLFTIVSHTIESLSGNFQSSLSIASFDHCLHTKLARYKSPSPKNAKMVKTVVLDCGGSFSPNTSSNGSESPTLQDSRLKAELNTRRTTVGALVVSMGEFAIEWATVRGFCAGRGSLEDCSFTGVG